MHAAVDQSLTLVHFLFWSFSALFEFLFLSRNHKNYSAGRSDGKTLALEIKYPILGVDPFALSYI